MVQKNRVKNLSDTYLLWNVVEKGEKAKKVMSKGKIGNSSEIF